MPKAEQPHRRSDELPCSSHCNECMTCVVGVLPHSHRAVEQAERKTADWQRAVLTLAPLNWAALQQAEAAVTRHAQLWAAWAGLQAAWADWNTRALLDSTGQARPHRRPATCPCPVQRLGRHRLRCAWSDVPLRHMLLSCSHVHGRQGLLYCR